MKKQEPIEEGKVIEALPAAHFKVEMRDGRTIHCHLAGRMHLNRVRVIPGDWVAVVVSGGIGRIIRRR